MQKISNMLGSRKMTPRERVRLQFQHYIILDKTGHGILSQADIYALSYGWKPKYSSEVREYNTFFEGMKLENSMRLDIQSLVLTSQLLFVQISKIIIYTMIGEYTDRKHDDLLLISHSEIQDFMSRYSGFNYNHLVESHPEMKLEIDTLIEQGVLIVKSVEEQIVDTKISISRITAESISTLPDTHVLKIKYKNQITYYEHFVSLFLFIQKSDILKSYRDLLAIKNIYEKLTVIYGIDTEYYLLKLIQELDKSIEQLNDELLLLLHRIEDDLYKRYPLECFIQIPLQELLLKKPEADMYGRAYTLYNTEYKALFPYEFK